MPRDEDAPVDVIIPPPLAPPPEPICFTDAEEVVYNPLLDDVPAGADAWP